MSRPHVLYVTPMFGYPAFGGPRLRTYNTLKALARCADVSLFLTQQPDTADREMARKHLLTFCREVVFPEPPPTPTGPRATARRLMRRYVPARLRAVAAGLTSPLWFALRASLGSTHRAVSLSGGTIRRGFWAALSAGTVEASTSARPPEQIAALKTWIDAHRPDLLWLGFGGISYDLIPLKHHAAVSVVLETECVWSRFILRELPYAQNAVDRERILAEGRAKEAEEQAGAPLVDITTAVSEIDADYFRGLTPDVERVMLLANVIDVDSYVADSSAPVQLQQPALVFAGTMSHGTANVDAALWLLDEVMSLVWRSRPDVHVYMVGRSPAPAIVARRGPRVHVTGEVPSIVPFMRAARAALVPLRWESGTRFKILEAFACRTPVISTTLGAEGLAVEHGRHLLLADEPSTFAAAILSLLDDPAHGQRLTGPAYALVRQEYDVSSAERQIKAILRRLGVAEQVPAL